MYAYHKMTQYQIRQGSAQRASSIQYVKCGVYTIRLIHPGHFLQLHHL